MSGPGATHTAGLAELATAIRDGAMTSVDVTRSFLQRIERLDARFRAFVTLDAAGALRQAESLDAKLRTGEPAGPLHGVPLVYKDLFHIDRLPNTCGTRIPHYFSSQSDAFVVRRLRQAGAVTLGKVTLSELAMGLFGLNDVQGTPVNPWAPERVPGGSSSGCGVAVAAGLAVAAIGTDTGGSIRIPAACCGVAGLKPSDGLVGRSGTMPMCYTLDHAGPMARRVRDLAPLLSAMAGHDADDDRSVHTLPVDYSHARPLQGVRIGVPSNDYFGDVDAVISSAIEEALRVMADFGMQVRPIALPDPQPMIDATLTLVRAESAAEHGRRLGDGSDALQPMLRARLEQGSRIPAVDYVRAYRTWSAYRREFVKEVFAEVDVLVAPSIPELPPPIAEIRAHNEETTRRLNRFGKFMRFFNGLGVPVLAVPCGFSAAGVPLGLQIAGRPFEEATLLTIGSAYEDATRWFMRQPPLAQTAEA